MELEFLTYGTTTEDSYPFVLLKGEDGLVVDWAQMIRALVDDVRGNVSTGLAATKFHNTLAEMIVGVALRNGEKKVALSGGCFQNRYLTERAVQRLQSEGMRPYWHQRVPPNDGGIALGQVAAVARANSKTTVGEGQSVCA